MQKKCSSSCRYSAIWERFVFHTQKSLSLNPRSLDQSQAIDDPARSRLVLSAAEIKRTNRVPMVALANWASEDDILLKNAVEAGASLESLAKGAVNFTRKFTLKELQDRWRALLYDSGISADASARIIELEANKTNPNSSPNPNRPCSKEKDTSQSGEKRKRDSVRSRYYAMRKRVSMYQPLEMVSHDIDAFADTLENELQSYDYQDNDNNNDNIAPFLSDEAGVGPPFDPQDYGTDIMSPKMCSSLENENINLESETGNKPGIGSRDPDPFWRSIEREKEQEVISQSKSSEEAVPNTEITHISDYMDFSSLDFTIENEFLQDTSCSIFLSSPQDDVANNVANNTTGTEPVCTEVERNGNNNINNYNAEIENLVSGTGGLGDKFMICVSNTEDPEVPDNNHVCFDDVPSNPNPNFERNCDIVGSSTMPVMTERKGITGDLIEIKAGDPLVPIPVPVPDIHEPSKAPMDPSSLPKRDCFVPLAPLIRTVSGSHEYNANPVQIQGLVRQNSISYNESNPSFKDDSAPQAENSKDVLMETPVQGQNDDDANYCSAIEQALITGSGSGSDLLVVGSVSDNEDEKVSEESENEVPSFSDVEAMILEMDLSPNDQESLIAKEGMRFQSAESRKNVIRLEQGARSYMNRAILSRSAFAVLYGRHTKYFIKNPEVSIGRETEDIKVDIDLGKEGRANKISRRQAIIKMDENGLFHIKNIGKCTIFVNSKEVLAKKRTNLTSGALIEIRDMRFIFEANEKAVNRYIFTMAHTGQSQHAKFEWIPV